MESEKTLITKTAEPIPFTLVNVGEIMDLEKLKPPEGCYDEQDQIWKLDDGSIPDYKCTRAGQETTWDATATPGGGY